MSTSKQIERAVRRADRRDKKRRPKMKVTGKSVFGLSRLLGRGR